MVTFISRGKLLETSIISSFGVLSFSQGFSWGLNLWQAIGVATLAMMTLFVAFSKQLSESSLGEAQEAIAG